MDGVCVCVCVCVSVQWPCNCDVVHVHLKVARLSVVPNKKVKRSTKVLVGQVPI